MILTRWVGGWRPVLLIWIGELILVDDSPQVCGGVAATLGAATKAEAAGGGKKKRRGEAKDADTGDAAVPSPKPSTLNLKTYTLNPKGAGHNGFSTQNPEP